MEKDYISYQCLACGKVAFRGTAKEVRALNEALEGLCHDCHEEKYNRVIRIPENKGVGNRHPATPRSETRYYSGEVN